MSTDLLRFGVAMESELLERFDALLARRGYSTRSEALRDLVRAALADDAPVGGATVAATLTLVYDHHVRELTERLNAMQHDLGAFVVSTLHVHMTHEHCLEVIVLRGPADVLKTASDRLLATKGVLQGKLVVAPMPSAPAVTHSHVPASTHRYLRKRQSK
ncbi:MAG: nickel-responsive transcriptional regulator NikR [Deltaproteobacteria bacterium]|nr:nickel-responsive transcriptional regulator NikR [Deltaproteobacteria bacterium]